MSLDRKTVEELYRTYAPLVRRRARSILGDPHEAEDAVHEVFIKVLNALDEFRGESRPSTWLYRITTNLCLNRLRDNKRHKGRLDELAATHRSVNAAIATNAEGRLTVQTVLAQVAPELAEAAVYYHVDEMDQEEIAAIAGVARRTVGYRLERFREEAQKAMQEPARSGSTNAADAPATDDSHEAGNDVPPNTRPEPT